MADECPAYTAWIRKQACLACDAEPCGGTHHVGSKGTSQRTHDSQAIPLCQGCHVEELHQLRGWARGLEKRNRKPIERNWLELTQRRAREAGWFFHPDGMVRVNDDRSVEVF